MAPPAHLAKYDALLDLLVEQLVREALQEAETAIEAETKTPVGSRLPTGASHDKRKERPDDYASAAPAATPTA
jgi:hypothetical protein